MTRKAVIRKPFISKTVNKAQEIGSTLVSRLRDTRGEGPDMKINTPGRNLYCSQDHHVIGSVTRFPEGLELREDFKPTRLHPVRPEPSL